MLLFGFIQFFKLEAASGIILIIITILTLLISNSSLYPLYKNVLTIPVIVQIGSFGLDKPILLWINDGLMAIFFCSVAIEIKRKILQDKNSDYKTVLSQVKLPAIGALGGIIIPALIFVIINIFDHKFLRGWAIPTATDIAFSLAILSLFGSKIPPFFKLFLVMLAVIDDLVAIIIIALFYTSNLSVFSLSLAFIGLVILFILNRLKVNYIMSYVWVGAFLWVCMIKSGVHATLTGVVVGFALPITSNNQNSLSPLIIIEHELQRWVPYFILPLFVLANAGVPLSDVSFAKLLEPLSLGIALGLAVGKPLGVILFVLWAKRIDIISLPNDFDLKLFIATAMLTGIGFTMSLFIGTLAFEETLIMSIRIGVLTGSTIAAIAGGLLIATAIKNPA